MSSPPMPLVKFYDLSGPKTWSWACWLTRYTLNYKKIPYTITKLSYPSIRPTCEALFPSMEGIEATVPIVEILEEGGGWKALNDSLPIARLLNDRFTEKEGYRGVKGLGEVEEYEKKVGSLRVVLRWIVWDVYENALDKEDGSREYFKRTREEKLGCGLKDAINVLWGGEAKVLQELKETWTLLQERMKNDDGIGEPTYIDFYDAAHVRWIEAASHEKYERLLGLYGDDTFEKLMKKVAPYEG